MKLKGDPSTSRAINRRLILNLLRQEKTAKIGIKARCLKAGWRNNYLLKVVEAVNEMRLPLPSLLALAGG